MDTCLVMKEKILILTKEMHGAFKLENWYELRD